MPVFEFDRYVYGQLKAEGVIITKEPTLEAALETAKKLYCGDPRFQHMEFRPRAPVDCIHNGESLT